MQLPAQTPSTPAHNPIVRYLVQRLLFPHPNILFLTILGHPVLKLFYCFSADHFRVNGLVKFALLIFLCTWQLFYHAFGPKSTPTSRSGPERQLLADTNIARYCNHRAVAQLTGREKMWPQTGKKVVEELDGRFKGLSKSMPLPFTLLDG